MRSWYMILATAICFAVPAFAENPPPDPGLFQQVVGTWGWKDSPQSSCTTAPHKISFADKNQKMLIEHSNGKRSVYQVMYAEKNMITTVIDGEERRTDAGDRVVWVLVLNNPASYHWRRTDWKAEVRTAEIVRCVNQ